MERSIRKTKRELLAKRIELDNPGDADVIKLQADYDKLAYDLRTKNQKYNNFLAENNFKKEYERTKVGGFNRKQSAQANGAATRYQDQQEKANTDKKSGLTGAASNGKMNAENESASLEFQRYGRNKETVINHTYINSGEYRRKFDKITDNADINRILYAKAKEMLNHRSGTKYEDMYWIDGTSGKVVASALNEQKESGIHYTKPILEAISEKPNLIAFHNHPASMPPSAEDFNSMHLHGYDTAFVACHDGTIYQYVAREEIRPRLHQMYIDEYIRQGYSEKEAQLKSLEELKKSYNIDFWEVKP